MAPEAAEGGSFRHPAPPVQAVAGDRASGPPPFGGSGFDSPEPIWDRICFYSSPFGDPKTERRDHSDGLLKTVIEPAIEAVDPSMRVVRADQLPSSSITAGVYEYVERSRLVIGDLSFHNANVLHEIGVRHGRGMPCVLLSRKEDAIPSNLRDHRIIRLNTSHVWGFADEVATMQSEVTEQARWALSNGGGGLWRPFGSDR